MPYRGILEVEQENARLQTNIIALQADRQRLEEDNNLQRATEDDAKQKVKDLEEALAATRKAQREDQERLESVIALGRELLKEREYYRNCHPWLMEQYQQYQQLLHSRESNNNAATDDQDVAAGGSCSEAPATSLEGEQVHMHTVAPSPPRQYYSISLRVHAGVNMPTFLKPPAVLHLAFSCKSRADTLECDENTCTINRQRVKLPCGVKKEEACAEESLPKRVGNWISRCFSYFC